MDATLRTGPTGRRPFAGALLAALIGSTFALAAGAPPVLGSTTFVVNRTGDGADINLANSACDVSTNAGSQCTLRAAIQEANDTPGADTITFDITTASKRIQPSTPLPPITEAVTINGYSQSGASVNTLANGDNAVLQIVLDGVNHGQDMPALVIDTSGVLIRGLVICRFGTGAAIVINGKGNTIRGNFIGTGRLGNGREPNLFNIQVNGDDNVIGGTAAGQRNLISGSFTSGIAIAGTGNVVQGNYIGTDASGTAAIANDGAGIAINSDLNTIGGTGSARNVVSGNGSAGIFLNQANSNTITGNRVGTKADGTGDLGNGGEGIRLQSSSSNTIGGTDGAAGNAIVGNAGDGIEIVGMSFNNVVRSNGIVANDGNGILVGRGITTIIGNAINGNTGDGVQVSSTGNSITIRGNVSIANGGLGIDLVGGTEDGFGVTANDAGDGDSGANSLQNYPVLTAASRSTATGITTISGTLNSLASTAFTVDLYLVVADASNHGESQALVGTKAVTTNSSGNASFSFALGGLAPGQVVTTTATGTSTSEFSANRAIAPVP